MKLEKVGRKVKPVELDGMWSKLKLWLTLQLLFIRIIKPSF